METTEPKSSENDITRDDSDQKERLIDLKNEYKDQLPVHVGFIPDGNRRWSRKTGVHRNVGHYRGYEVVKKILVACHHAGIKYLSLYALSLENAMKRPADELAYIFKLLIIAINQIKKEPIVTENTHCAARCSRRSARPVLWRGSGPLSAQVQPAGLRAARSAVSVFC